MSELQKARFTKHAANIFEKLRSSLVKERRTAGEAWTEEEMANFIASVLPGISAGVREFALEQLDGLASRRLVSGLVANYQLMMTVVEPEAWHEARGHLQSSLDMVSSWGFQWPHRQGDETSSSDRD